MKITKFKTGDEVPDDAIHLNSFVVKDDYEYHVEYHFFLVWDRNNKK